MFLLFRYQVATVDRRSFGEIGAEGKHFLRLSIATGLDDLKEALARIAQAGADRQGFAAFVREGKAPVLVFRVRSALPISASHARRWQGASREDPVYVADTGRETQHLHQYLR